MLHQSATIFLQTKCYIEAITEHNRKNHEKINIKEQNKRWEKISQNKLEINDNNIENYFTPIKNLITNHLLTSSDYIIIFDFLQNKFVLQSNNVLQKESSKKKNTKTLKDLFLDLIINYCASVCKYELKEKDMIKNIEFFYQRLQSQKCLLKFSNNKEFIQIYQYEQADEKLVSLFITYEKIKYQKNLAQKGKENLKPSENLYKLEEVLKKSYDIKESNKLIKEFCDTPIHKLLLEKSTAFKKHINYLNSKSENPIWNLILEDKDNLDHYTNLLNLFINYTQKNIWAITDYNSMISFIDEKTLKPTDPIKKLCEEIAICYINFLLKNKNFIGILNIYKQKCVFQSLKIFSQQQISLLIEKEIPFNLLIIKPDDNIGHLSVNYNEFQQHPLFPIIEKKGCAQKLYPTKKPGWELSSYKKFFSNFCKDSIIKNIKIPKLLKENLLNMIINYLKLLLVKKEYTGIETIFNDQKLLQIIPQNLLLKTIKSNLWIQNPSEYICDEPLESYKQFYGAIFKKNQTLKIQLLKYTVDWLSERLNLTCLENEEKVKSFSVNAVCNSFNFVLAFGNKQQKIKIKNLFFDQLSSIYLYFGTKESGNNCKHLQCYQFIKEIYTILTKENKSLPDGTNENISNFINMLSNPDDDYIIPTTESISHFFEVADFKLQCIRDYCKIYNNETTQSILKHDMQYNHMKEIIEVLHETYCVLRNFDYLIPSLENLKNQNSEKYNTQLKDLCHKFVESQITKELKKPSTYNALTTKLFNKLIRFLPKNHIIVKLSNCIICLINIDNKKLYELFLIIYDDCKNKYDKDSHEQFLEFLTECQKIKNKNFLVKLFPVINWLTKIKHFPTKEFIMDLTEIKKIQKILPKEFTTLCENSILYFFNNIERYANQSLFTNYQNLLKLYDICKLSENYNPRELIYKKAYEFFEALFPKLNFSDIPDIQKKSSSLFGFFKFKSAPVNMLPKLKSEKFEEIKLNPQDKKYKFLRQIFIDNEIAVSKRLQLKYDELKHKLILMQFIINFNTYLTPDMIKKTDIKTEISLISFIKNYMRKSKNNKKLLLPDRLFYLIEKIINHWGKIGDNNKNNNRGFLKLLPNLLNYCMSLYDLLKMLDEKQPNNYNNMLTQLDNAIYAVAKRCYTTWRNILTNHVVKGKLEKGYEAYAAAKDFLAALFKTNKYIESSTHNKEYKNMEKDYKLPVIKPTNSCSSWAEAFLSPKKSN